MRDNARRTASPARLSGVHATRHDEGRGPEQRDLTALATRRQWRSASAGFRGRASSNQKSARLDSIAARELLLAEFYNNIGQLRTLAAQQSVKDFNTMIELVEYGQSLVRP